MEEETLDELAYLGADEETEGAIVRALVRLPEDVRAFALERCRFLSIGRVAVGKHFPGSIGVDPFTRRTRNVWLILIDERQEEEELQSTVAHEIAHAWRGDETLGPLDETEVATAALARDWGFTGQGADPQAERRRIAAIQDALAR